MWTHTSTPHSPTSLKQVQRQAAALQARLHSRAHLKHIQVHGVCALRATQPYSQKLAGAVHREHNLEGEGGVGGQCSTLRPLQIMHACNLCMLRVVLHTAACRLVLAHAWLPGDVGWAGSQENRG